MFKIFTTLIFIVTIFIGIILFTPTPTLAQGLAQLAQCTGPDCGTCEVIKLANGLIGWFITFVFLLFALLFMRAGVKLVTSGGNPGALQAAKDSFVNALIGLIIVFAAWLIVDTLMKALVGPADNPGALKLTTGQHKGYLFWAEIECTAQVTPRRANVVYVDLPNLEADAAIVDGTDALPVPPGGTGANCSVNESTLVTIPGQSGQRATADTVNRFVSMQRRLAAQGIALSVTSSYRSDADQTKLWNDCPICQSERTIARPCSKGGNGSAHTSGLALDLTSSGTRCDIVRACRWAGASFIMLYRRSGHVHCDWRGGERREVAVNCPQ